MSALIACALAVVAAFGTGATAAGAVGHLHRCSVYEIGGGAMVTFTNWVAPALGGGHGEPPFDCLYEAAELTVHNVGDSVDSANEWSTTPQRQAGRLVLACTFHFQFIGEPVTVTVRSTWASDPLCADLLTHPLGR
jgi:hypothetical protein